MKKLLIIGLLLSTTSLRAHAQATGDILALQHAYFSADDAKVEEYLQKGLARTPDDPALINQAMLSAIYEGNLAKASGYLPQVKKLKIENATSSIIELASGIATKDFDRAVEFSKDLKFLDPVILKAWASAQKGDVKAAETQLIDAGKVTAELAPLYQYETAMIKAQYAMDYAGAAKLLDGDKAPIYLSDESFLGHMVLKILAEDQSAQALIEKRYGAKDQWPEAVRIVIEKAGNGKIDEALAIASPQNAMGEYLSFVLEQSKDVSIPPQTERLFTQLIPAMSSNFERAKLDLLQYYYANGELDDVLRTAERIKDESIYSAERDLYKFGAYMQTDREADARKLIESVKPGDASALHSIADSYRQLEDYPKALQLYQQVLTYKDLPISRIAQVTYSAAISAQELGLWPQAERAFRAAIALDPENAEMLNNLGYSLVDRSEKIDEGLKMIEKAMKIKPDAAYIQDSMGWAYFKAGRFADAVKPLELAASQMSIDSAVNLHLGDVYWKLDRKREAQYQWVRALKFLEADRPDVKKADLEKRIQNGLAD